MKKRKILPIRKYECTDYQKVALKSILPPENLTVSQWAEKRRVLDSKTSAMAGEWRNSITPYLVGIMDEFNNPTTEEIIFVKPTQVGGTECILNIIGYIVEQDPAPTLVVYPTEENAKFFSQNRIEPVFLNSHELAKIYDKNNSSILELQFKNNMYLSLAGSNSPANLASKPIKYLFLDEVDKYPGASKKEADPVSLSRERTKTFHNRKIFIPSTPTYKNGHIWRLKESADVEKHNFVPCLHCGKLIELKFSQIKWPDKEDMSYADRAEFANYVCQECGCIITDKDKLQMLQYGKWKEVKRRTQYAKKIVFWMNTLYSPFTRFSEIAKEFLMSKDDPEKFQNFVNSWLAEPWEDTKLKTNADLVLEKRTSVPQFVVPEWAKMLTAGVDVQENCLYWTIRAWGDYLKSQKIASGQAHSFGEVNRLMNLMYKKESDEEFIVCLCLVDSGDNTDEVYDFCAENSDWAVPCKGASHSMYDHFKRSRINKSGSKAYGMDLILINTGKYKDMIAARMQKKIGSTGSWMVDADCTQEYANQVTAEHKITERSGKNTTQVWVLKSSHADNHYLDCEVMCTCAADIMGARTMHLKEIEEQEIKKPDSQQETPEENWIKANESWI